MINIHILSFSYLGSLGFLGAFLKRDHRIICLRLGFLNYCFGFFLCRFFVNRLFSRCFFRLIHLLNDNLGKLIDKLDLCGVFAEDLLFELGDLLLHCFKSGKLLDHIASCVDRGLLGLNNSFFNYFLCLFLSFFNNIVRLILRLGKYLLGGRIKSFVFGIRSLLNIGKELVSLILSLFSDLFGGSLSGQECVADIVLVISVFFKSLCKQIDLLIHLSVFTEHLLIRVCDFLNERIDAFCFVSISSGGFKMVVCDFCRC